MFYKFYRDDLDRDEYTETKNDTLEQLKEFSNSLNSMKGGNLSLVNDLNRIQLVRIRNISKLFAILRASCREVQLTLQLVKL